MHARSLRRLFALLIGLLCPLGFAQQSANIASQIELLNRNLEMRPRLGTLVRGRVSPDVLNVLEVRQKLVEQLIRTDPGLVRSVMLSPAVAEELSATSPTYAAAMEAAGNWSGTLEATIEDDFEHGTSRTHWYIQRSTPGVVIYRKPESNTAGPPLGGGSGRGDLRRYQRRVIAARHRSPRESARTELHFARR